MLFSDNDGCCLLCNSGCFKFTLKLWTLCIRNKLNDKRWRHKWLLICCVVQYCSLLFNLVIQVMFNKLTNLATEISRLWPADPLIWTVLFTSVPSVAVILSSLYICINSAAQFGFQEQFNFFASNPHITFFVQSDIARLEKTSVVVRLHTIYVFVAFKWEKSVINLLCIKEFGLKFLNYWYFWIKRSTFLWTRIEAGSVTWEISWLIDWFWK